MRALAGIGIAMTPASMAEPRNFRIHPPKHVVDAVSTVFGRCVRWVRSSEALFSVGVHARSCLASALGSRPSESSGILRETLTGARLIDKEYVTAAIVQVVELGSGCPASESPRHFIHSRIMATSGRGSHGANVTAQNNLGSTPRLLHPASPQG
jgi:hypothetical protein